MAKKIALGKGIASLLQDTSTPQSVVLNSYANQNFVSSSESSESDDHYHDEVDHGEEQTLKNSEGIVKIEHTPLLIAIEKIKPNSDQPRKIFKEKELDELAESIKENGIIQPLIVVELEKGEFELIAGERRLRAAKKAGLEMVPAVVKRATDREKAIFSLLENIQRADLNCVEEALAYYKLMNEYKLTQEEVSKKLGKERSSIANYLRILNLPRPILDQLQKELLSFGHGKILASVKDREEAIRFANEVVTQGWSVKELEEALKNKGKKKDNEYSSSNTNPFFNEKLDQFKSVLEQKTGYHFQLSSGKNGQGSISIKFSNEAEFNDIYEYLLSK